MNTDQAWREWGRRDPYYGVLSDQRFRRDNLADNIASFHESGIVHWAMIRANLERLYSVQAPGTVVDFGCGVGRILQAIAKEASCAIGIDVSEDMLAEARRNCPNAILIASDDTLSRLAGPVDLVHSFIVLQHIPVPRGMNFMRILLDKLAPGGTSAFHITLRRPQRIVNRIVYFMKHRLPGMRVVFNLLQGKKINEPVMQMNEYDLPAVLNMFTSAQMGDIVLLPVDAGGTHGVLIFARKHA